MFNIFFDICEGISNVTVNRDSQNAPFKSSFPAVLPQEVARVRPRVFYRLLQDQKSRLLHSFEPEKISQVDDEFRSLQRELNPGRSYEDRDFTARDFESFSNAWSKYPNKYQVIRHFFGVLALVFPGNPLLKLTFPNWARRKRRKEQHFKDLHSRCIKRSSVG